MRFSYLVQAASTFVWALVCIALSPEMAAADDKSAPERGSRGQIVKPEDVPKGVVTIDVVNCLGRVLPCPGAVVGPNAVASARHVFDSAVLAQVNLGPEGAFPVEAVLVDDPFADVIVMRVQLPPGTAEVQRRSGTFPGREAELRAFRPTGEGGVRCVRGNLISIEYVFECLMIEAEIPLVHGDSGSPVFDERSELVGFITGFSAEGAYVTPAFIIDGDGRLDPPVRFDVWSAPNASPSGQRFARAYRDGQSLMQSSDNPEERRKCLDAVLKERPHHVNFATYAATTRSDAVNVEPTGLQTLAETNPKFAARLSMAVGHRLMRDRDFVRAREFYERSLAARWSAGAAYWLAAALCHSKSYSLALAILDETALKDTRCVSCFELMHHIGSLTGDAAVRVSALERLTELVPEDQYWMSSRLSEESVTIPGEHAPFSAYAKNRMLLAKRARDAQTRGPVIPNQPE